MQEYKGYRYFKDIDGLWKIVLPDGGLFVVALDDSKSSGRRVVVDENNTEEKCKEFIDWELHSL